jgi:hypothetical protein
VGFDIVIDAAPVTQRRSHGSAVGLKRRKPRVFFRREKEDIFSNTKLNL